MIEKILDRFSQFGSSCIWRKKIHNNETKLRFSVIFFSDSLETFRCPTSIPRLPSSHCEFQGTTASSKLQPRVPRWKWEFRAPTLAGRAPLPRSMVQSRAPSSRRVQATCQSSHQPFWHQLEISEPDRKSEVNLKKNTPNEYSNFFLQIVFRTTKFLNERCFETFFAEIKVV